MWNSKTPVIFRILQSRMGDYPKPISVSLHPFKPLDWLKSWMKCLPSNAAASCHWIFSVSLRPCNPLNWLKLIQQGFGNSNIETADRVSQFYFSQFKALTAAKLTETVFQQYSPKPFFGSITCHLQKSRTNVIVRSRTSGFTVLWNLKNGSTG